MALALGLFAGCVPPADDDDATSVRDDDDSAPLRACNGSPLLCDRPFDEVALPSTHNSMSNAEDGWIAPNQQFSIERQLDDGIRGMMFDTYYDGGEIVLCHTYCQLGSRPLVDALEGVAGFLEAHPDEVVAIIFQDAVSAEDTAAAFEAAGLPEAMYAWDGGPWPTLAEMLDAGQRLVVGAESRGPPPAWYHQAWDVWQDTPYSFNSVDAFSCAPNRGTEESPLFLVNHWVSDPLSTEANAFIANAEEVLGPRVEECMAERGRLPNMVAVDHYAVGDLFSVVDRLNGVE